MTELRLHVSPGFLLMAAALYFAGGLGALCALTAAAAAHELGHLAALLAAGALPTGLRLGAGGATLDHTPPAAPWGMTVILAAGPLAGLLFALACLAAGGEYAAYVGAVALLATAFNLLPALPLDGGRLAELLIAPLLPPGAAALLLRLSGSLCSAGLFALGLRLTLPTLSAAGIWLGILVNFPGLR